MGKLRTALRAVRHALTRPAPSEAAAAELEAGLSLIEADRLARFARTFARYSRPELAELGEALSEIPDASAAIAAQFAAEHEAAALRRTLAAQARVRLTGTASATAVTLARSRNHTRAALILRRVSRVYLRALSPRSPGLPALA